MRRGRNRRELVERGEAARRLHSAWLTHHLHAKPEPPRIPVRTVRAGGFAKLLCRPHGARRASRWWFLALDRTDQ